MEDFIKKSIASLAKVGEAFGLHNLDPDPGLIFVTGGTGVIGHRVAKRLLDAGYSNIRLGTSKPNMLEDMNKKGAQIADFCWEREETYEKALVGVTSVLCTIPFIEGWYKHFEPLVDACKKAGVKHFIKLSFFNARKAEDQLQDVPLIREHGYCDDMLIKLILPDTNLAPVMMGPDMADLGIDVTRPNMSYTILYASHYMSNVFTFQGRELRSKRVPSSFYGASGNHGVNYVSPNDVAEAAIRILLDPRTHYNKEYTITGPGAITDQQVADLLSKYLNKPIMYVDQSIRQFGKEIKMSGEPKWLVHDLLALEQVKRSGREEGTEFISNDFEEICGHGPESFDEYLKMVDMMTAVESQSPVEANLSKENVAAEFHLTSTVA